MNSSDRRAFLKLLASPALAAALPIDLSRALAIPAHNRTGTIEDVEHIVILMQENRSFDHYFGTMRGVRGFADPRAVKLPSGKPVWHQPTELSDLLPFRPDVEDLGMTFLPDPPHGWTDTHAAWNEGRYDQWVPNKGVTTMTFHTRRDLPYQYALVDAFTICDNYHCSLMGPTDPNCYHMWTGWVGNDGRGGGPVITNAEAGYDWSTYPERLQRAGISWKSYQDVGVGLDAEGFWGFTDDPYIGNFGDNSLLYFHQYQNALPGNPFADRAKTGTNVLLQNREPDRLMDIFRDDVQNGRLPRVSWIVAPEGYCEHPNWEPDFGAWYVSQVIDILSSNPDVWSRMALFITYDEEGGFFDHLVPPTPPTSPTVGRSTVAITNEIFGASGCRSPPGRRCRFLWRAHRCPALHRLQPVFGCESCGYGTADRPAIRSARRRAADCARLRVRQRLPRHRQRGGDGDLHPLAARSCGGHLVGPVQLPRGAGVERGGGVRHHRPPAGRAHSESRIRVRFRDGVRAADRRDRLESRNLVVWSAGVELAHADRIDHRRRPGQPAPRRRRSGKRRRLGAGNENRVLATAVAARRFRRGGAAAAHLADTGPPARAVSGAQGHQPPPLWVRSLLILTCTGVSFAHGSNDGQKGMGLIMLILIGVVPTAYALNRSVPDSAMPAFLRTSSAVVQAFDRGGAPGNAEARTIIGNYLRTRVADPAVLPAIATLSRSIATQVQHYGSLRLVPAAAVENVRNDMYLASEAIRHATKESSLRLTKADTDLLGAYKKELDGATRFIPTWVKVAVAVALGLGTMVGWKRIVITVGEKIGKSHLSYGQGMSAELVAATTIAAADMYGLPVSTTHVLSSGVAGTMAANGSGLQWATVRNMLMAWVLTLPVAIVLAGTLYTIFAAIF